MMQWKDITKCLFLFSWSVWSTHLQMITHRMIKISGRVWSSSLRKLLPLILCFRSLPWSQGVDLSVSLHSPPSPCRFNWPGWVHPNSEESDTYQLCKNPNHQNLALHYPVHSDLQWWVWVGNRTVVACNPQPLQMDYWSLSRFKVPSGLIGVRSHWDWLVYYCLNLGRKSVCFV